jgi:hypothetical protein
MNGICAPRRLDDDRIRTWPICASLGVANISGRLCIARKADQNDLGAARRDGGGTHQRAIVSALCEDVHGFSGDGAGDGEAEIEGGWNGRSLGCHRMVEIEGFVGIAV